MDPGLQHHQGRLIRWLPGTDKDCNNHEPSTINYCLFHKRLRLERQQQSGSPMEAWKLSSGIMY